MYVRRGAPPLPHWKIQGWHGSQAQAWPSEISSLDVSAYYPNYLQPSTARRSPRGPKATPPGSQPRRKNGLRTGGGPEPLRSGGGDGRIRTGDRGFADPRLNHLATSPWSGRRGSNSRPPPWQGGALPLSYFRSLSMARPPRRPSHRCLLASPLVPRRGFEPLRPKARPPQDRVSAYSTTSAWVSFSGRSGGIRTPDRRFWRPLLYRTELHSYWPEV